MDESFVAVMRSDELVAGAENDPNIRRVRVGDEAVLLVRLKGGEVMAFAPICPHQSTDLELAKLWDGNVRCSRHNYLYDPRTGENIQPTQDHKPENLWKLKPGYLPTYPVVEEAGWIHVGPQRPPPPSYDPELEVRPADSAEPVEAEPDPQEVVTEQLSARCGSTFELRLPMSPLPGYEWQLEVEGPLSVHDDSALDDEQHELRVRVTANAAGEAFITCGYCAPWEAEPSEFRYYRVDISD